jgi:parvulin-like peptidyl-prolyl isomerase
MRLFREPLFHFFLLGLAIFSWFVWLNPPDPDAAESNRIVIDERDVQRLDAQFQRTWQRPPTEVELKSLIEAIVREEVLVREAQALGLDQGDAVIRNRLSQKMAFLTTSVAQSMEPDDAELAEYLAQYPDRFVRSGKIAFEQVQLTPDTDPSTALAAIKDGADPVSLAERSLLPPVMQPSPEQSVDATFGRGFFAALADLPVGEWAGPIQSGYGAHLVRVQQFQPAELPPLEDVREEVLLEWRREASQKLTEAQIEGLKAQYEIVVPDDTALAEWTSK